MTKLQVEEPPYIIATGAYRDVVVRTPEWRFESRELAIDRGVFARAELQASAAAGRNGGAQCPSSPRNAGAGSDRVW